MIAHSLSKATYSAPAQNLHGRDVRRRRRVLSASSSTTTASWSTSGARRRILHVVARRAELPQPRRGAGPSGAATPRRIFLAFRAIFERIAAEIEKRRALGDAAKASAFACA
jgi:hypothetical protein